MANMLITGACGFIGSHLCDSLLEMGHSIIGVDNMRLGTEQNIAHLESNHSFSFYNHDVAELGGMDKIFKENSIDTVFHLAANSDIAQSHEEPDVDIVNTFQTTAAVLSLMRKYAVKNIVFASSSAIYGDAKGKIDENFGPLNPVSHYGACKLASEGLISSYVENYNLKAWIARFPNVVGDRATHGVVFDFINKLKANPDVLEVLGDGTQNKPYIYVKDIVQAILFIWQNSSDKINIFNIGIESRTSVKKIAELVVQEMNLSPDIQYGSSQRGWIGDVPEYEYDQSKIHNLGWKAQFSSDDAILHSIRKILNK